MQHRWWTEGEGQAPETYFLIFSFIKCSAQAGSAQCQGQRQCIFKVGRRRVNAVHVHLHGLSPNAKDGRI